MGAATGSDLTPFSVIRKQFMRWLFLCCLRLADGVRFDCYPEQGASPERCNERGCTWQATDEKTVPWCFMKNELGYKNVSTEGQVTMLKKKEHSKSPWSRDIEEIHFSSDSYGKTLNVKISRPGG
ncbi:hypothetical protein ANCCAN_19686 [Ancylostoma caninum]|uniref:P-type domain-containing protein n=1 Tax=Ancylostoma caninum TaxID=29170 RepID=A0A368FQH6_ANCCA|nr:hypothetical protein ANCCAN_19686 [Ancylostoma caninum]